MADILSSKRPLRKRDLEDLIARIEGLKVDLDQDQDLCLDEQHLARSGSAESVRKMSAKLKTLSSVNKRTCESLSTPDSFRAQRWVELQ